MNKILLLIRPENTDEENRYYIEAIEACGGEVVDVSDLAEVGEMEGKLKDINGILLPGGVDVGRFDYYLIEYAVKNGIRLLGICQGMQSMALLGSSDRLIEIGDLSHQLEERSVHSVFLSDGKLKEIVGKDVIMVNSHHIQTIKDSKKFLVVGRSSDGLIEAIEGVDAEFQIGVQWHPERMFAYDEASRLLFEKFLS